MLYIILYYPIWLPQKNNKQPKSIVAELFQSKASEHLKQQYIAMKHEVLA